MVEPGLLGAQEFSWKETQKSPGAALTHSPETFCYQMLHFLILLQHILSPLSEFLYPFLSSSPFRLNFNSCLLQRFHFTELSPLS